MPEYWKTSFRLLERKSCPAKECACLSPVAGMLRGKYGTQSFKGNVHGNERHPLRNEKPARQERVFEGSAALGIVVSSLKKSFRRPRFNKERLCCFA